MSRKQIIGEKKLKETTIKHEYLEKEEILLVRLIGTMQQVPSLEFPIQIKGKMEKYGCRKCLIDFRKGEMIIDIVTTANRPEKFMESNISRTNKVAFVVKAITTELQFYENVFVNNGYNFFMFDDYKKAKAWLKG